MGIKDLFLKKKQDWRREQERKEQIDDIERRAYEKQREEEAKKAGKRRAKEDYRKPRSKGLLGGLKDMATGGKPPRKKKPKRQSRSFELDPFDFV